MGKVVRCAECGKVYRDPEELEELRDNDSICMVCNAPIEVLDWDRILASWEDEEDLDDVDDDLEEEDWSDDAAAEEEDDFVELDEDEEFGGELGAGDEDADADADDTEEEEEEDR